MHREISVDQDWDLSSGVSSALGLVHQIGSNHLPSEAAYGLQVVDSSAANTLRVASPLSADLVSLPLSKETFVNACGLFRTLVPV